MTARGLNGGELKEIKLQGSLSGYAWGWGPILLG